MSFDELFDSLDVNEIKKTVDRAASHMSSADSCETFEDLKTNLDLAWEEVQDLVAELRLARRRVAVAIKKKEGG